MPDMKILELTNSIDPDKAAHNEPLIWIFSVIALLSLTSQYYSA